MEIISYLPPSPYCAQLLERLRVSLDSTAMEVFETLGPFLKRLLRPNCAEACLLIVPADQPELDSLLGHLDLLREIPLVMVAPDVLSSTLAKAHRMRPRFLTDREANSQEVVGVLKRILARMAEAEQSGGGGRGAGQDSSGQSKLSAAGGTCLRLI